MEITIIGTGNMARGIATRLLAGSHAVTLVGTSSEKARTLAGELSGDVRAAEIGDHLQGDVVLAIPYTAVDDVLGAYADQLDGKVVVDITNPVDVSAFTLLHPGAWFLSRATSSRIAWRWTSCVRALTVSSRYVVSASPGPRIEVPVAVPVHGDRAHAEGQPSEPEAVAAIVALRRAASDLMIFAGVDAEQADGAVREGTGDFRVPAPPSSPRAPFGLRRPTP